MDALPLGSRQMSLELPGTLLWTLHGSRLVLLIGPGSLQQNSSQDQEVQINTMISRVQLPISLLPYLRMAINGVVALLNAAYTYHRSYWWNPPSWTAWETSIRCDDPHGVCAKYPGAAAAYTINPGKRYDGKLAVTKDTIALCPSVFKAKSTCNDLIAYRKSHAADDYTLQSFQCQGE